MGMPCSRIGTFEGNSRSCWCSRGSQKGEGKIGKRRGTPSRHTHHSREKKKTLEVFGDYELNYTAIRGWKTNTGGKGIAQTPALLDDDKKVKGKTFTRPRIARVKRLGDRSGKGNPKRQERFVGVLLREKGKGFSGKGVRK